jgi:hypothetical protein
MQRGDIVELIKISRWGGRTPTGIMGILLRRAYLGYSPEDIEWDILINGEVTRVRRKQLRFNSTYTERGG